MLGGGNQVGLFQSIFISRQNGRHSSPSYEHSTTRILLFFMVRFVPSLNSTKGEAKEGV